MYLNHEKTRNIATPSRLGHPAPNAIKCTHKLWIRACHVMGGGVDRVMPLNVFFSFDLIQIVNTC